MQRGDLVDLDWINGLGDTPAIFAAGGLIWVWSSKSSLLGGPRDEKLWPGDDEVVFDDGVAYKLLC